VALYGVAILLGTLAGGSSLTQPLAVYTGGPGNLVGTGSSVTAAEDAGLVFQRIKSIEDLDRVVAAASSEGRSVMLDFYADWCISCKEMEHFTFTDQRVKDSLEGVILVQADVTANDDIDKALLERFRLFAPPAIIFYGPAGNEIPEARVVGFVKAERFSAHVDAVLTTSLAAGS
jgi:thiol:disulfide interchange protein DsbD